MQANLRKFFSGDLFPELKSKWSKAILWVVISYLAVFVFAGAAELFAPNN